ncbi:MAG: hypothetical protein U9Q62_04480 [Campylobacterota bacterium]|nr:hypothetical protein [Campylobacterota bacterium]
MKLIEEVKMFLNFKKKKQRKEVEKLRQIIFALSAKAKGLKKKCEEQKKAEKREKVEKEHKAVKKLLKKSRKRLEKIIKEQESSE